MFPDLVPDILVLEKQDGQRFDGIRAHVSGNTILIEDINLRIECVDKLIRCLPNGLSEEFIVDDPGFQSGLWPDPPFYAVKVHKAGAANVGLQPVTYNISGVSGPNARVNIHSHDHSSNAATIGREELTRLVTELTAHLNELNLDARQKQRAEVQIATLQTELAGDPDREIVGQAGCTLRNITEGAIGSLLATAAQPAVWQFIHQMLRNF
jgi:hypothetical protein